MSVGAATTTTMATTITTTVSTATIKTIAVNASATTNAVGAGHDGRVVEEVAHPEPKRFDDGWRLASRVAFEQQTPASTLAETEARSVVVVGGAPGLPASASTT